MVDAPRITKMLADIVGPQRVTDRDFDLIPYSRDLSPASQKLPTHVVMPETREEIQRILKLANEQNVPVYIRGGGTSHWDAYLAQQPGIMLDMGRMNRVVEINEADLTATVQPNCTWFSLDIELRKKGLTYLCSEAGGPAMTVGGSVMKAGGGPHSTAKFGFHGNQDVICLEMVLPNGDVLQTGSSAWPTAGKFERQCLGPDLAGMFLGAEGILGVCTELTMRVRPATDIRERLFATMKSLDDVVKFGHFINRNVGDEYLQGIYLWVDPNAPEVFIVMMDVFGYEREIIEHRKKRVLEKLKELGGQLGDPAPANDYFNGILSGLTGIFATGVWHFFGAGCLRIDDIKYVYDIWRNEVVGRYGYKKAGFGGQVLPRRWLAFMVLNYKEPEETAATLKMCNEIDEMVLNGPVVPYGIGGRDGLRRYVASHDTGYYRLLKTLKKTLDPKNILQRGIFIPEEELR